MMPTCFRQKINADQKIAELRALKVVTLANWQHARQAQHRSRRECAAYMKPSQAGGYA